MCLLRPDSGDLQGQAIVYALNIIVGTRVRRTGVREIRRITLAYFVVDSEANARIEEILHPNRRPLELDLELVAVESVVNVIPE